MRRFRGIALAALLTIAICGEKMPAQEPNPPQPTPTTTPALTPAPGSAILAHGGAGTQFERTPDVLPAIDAAWKALADGKGALDSAIAAAVALEDSPVFNAGTGSNIRLDGVTVQMDAAVMNEKQEFGAVAVIERVKNPVLVAHEVMRSPHLLLAGEGATRFARTLGMPDYDPRNAESLQRYKNLLEKMRGGALGEEWKNFDWKTHWNFPKSLEDVLKPSDTIGAVARDGKGGFAAAISTGGTSLTLHGRVGDVPIMGAGCYVGPAGAVCATGWGEHIVRQMLSRRVYDWMAEGIKPSDAVTKGLALFPPEVGIGLLAITAADHAASSNTSMAWAGMIDGKLLRADQNP